MQSKRSILMLVAFLGFGFFLKSRWDEVTRIEESNRVLEKRIARKWEQTVATRSAANRAAEVRRKRFELRKLAAVLIDARVEKRECDPEEIARFHTKISEMPMDEWVDAMGELQDSDFPDDVRIRIESMFLAGVDESVQDERIRDLALGALQPTRPEIARTIAKRISDPKIRAEVMHRLETEDSE